MLGRFRKANVLSKKKLGHIYDTAMKAVGKEPVIIELSQVGLVMNVRSW